MTLNIAAYFSLYPVDNCLNTFYHEFDIGASNNHIPFTWSLLSLSVSVKVDKCSHTASCKCLVSILLLFENLNLSRKEWKLPNNC